MKSVCCCISLVGTACAPFRPPQISRTSPPIVNPPSKPIGDAPLDFQTLKEFILDARCVTCHSEGSSSTAHDLPFTSYSQLADDTLRWTAPGESSRVIRALTRTDKFKMPPQGFGELLAADELKFIVDWIDAGKPEFANQ